MDNGFLRIGTVTAVNPDERTVRVFFQDEKFLSGWLKVIKNPPLIPTKDAPSTEAKSGGSGDSSFASHSHTLTVNAWLPDVNEVVLCIYNPVFNGDGYVLGAL